MSLVSRYVANVQRFLPPGMRDDVGQELQSLLEDRIEAEAERVGHPLAEAEIAAILREHGHPRRVAGSYLPAPGLASSGAFALYKRTLGRIVTIWFLVTIAVGLYEIYRDNGSSALDGLMGFWHGVYDLMALLLIAVTLVFHFIGDALDRSGRAWRWDPARLPQPQGTWLPVSLPRVIGGSILAMSFLALVVAAPHSFASSEVTVAVGDGVRPLLPVLHGLALFSLLLTIVNLLQRHVTRAKLYAWVAAAIAIAALVSWIIIFHRVLVLTQPGLGKWGSLFISVWPEVLVRALLALAALLLVRSAWRAWQRARTPGLPLI
jgi:hypothetical protein